MAVRLFAEDREIVADSFPIDAVTCLLVHALICSTRRCAPLYFRNRAAFIVRIDKFVEILSCPDNGQIFKLGG
jgi:hypothetical protein